MQEVPTVSSDITAPVTDETPKCDPCDPTSLCDYSCLFGDDFQIPDDFCDSAYLNILDSAAIEEGILHVLYASASQVCDMVIKLICYSDVLHKHIYLFLHSCFSLCTAASWLSVLVNFGWHYHWFKLCFQVSIYYLVVSAELIMPKNISTGFIFF